MKTKTTPQEPGTASASTDSQTDGRVAARRASARVRSARFRARWVVRVDYRPGKAAAEVIRRRQTVTGNTMQRVLDDLVLEADRHISSSPVRRR
jgi:hypothetical protein